MKTGFYATSLGVYMSVFRVIGVLAREEKCEGAIEASGLSSHLRIACVNSTMTKMTGEGAGNWNEWRREGHDKF